MSPWIVRPSLRTMLSGAWNESLAARVVAQMTVAAAKMAMAREFMVEVCPRDL